MRKEAESPGDDTCGASCASMSPAANSFGGDLEQSRRKFLAQSAGTLGLLFLDSLTPQLIAQATQHTRQASAAASQGFKFFTPQEAANFDAFRGADNPQH